MIGRDDAGELRRLAHAVADLVVDHHLGPATSSPGRRARQEDLAWLDEPAPRGPTPADVVLPQVVDGILPHLVKADHPRSFAGVPGPADPVAALADAVATGLNLTTVNWSLAAGPSQVELVTARWLAAALGMPAGSGGVFTSGGSVANLTAVAVARDRLGPPPHDRVPVVYLGEQAHPGVGRALRVLGFAPGQTRVLPCDDDRLVPDAVRAAVAADRAAGRRPLMLVATAGTTNTGTVDPLAELARVCRDEGLWFHVDGAFGAAAALGSSGSPLLDGLSEADSVAVDPHKWMFQPFGLGCLLLRDPGALAETFHLGSDYLAAMHDPGQSRDLGASGIEYTRPFRAFRLWFSIKVHGLDAVRDAVDRGLALASHLAAEVRRRPGFELLTGPRLAVVCFTHRAAGRDAPAHRRISDLLLDQSPGSLLLPTLVAGRPCFRACTTNPRTTEQDLDTLLDHVERLAVAGLEGRGGPSGSREER
ncbi:pyridoxal phosphate-dependent decarboxylase family protein [Saccharothrix texasensis]|uniref:Glutamate/tyrosine decarboxylase-like PLP-dependent enzyme n=1 Tax=Saccharothrix texasensis TaxID=103734 RepID=A0A3N1HGV8_9PSEU|nr:aminotransferase class V-fold PLP-dependent enzyme [Saccharothrix texasensis]ROP41735.1 glutamate/tyrosine decarboxylase-like PLP-dependent enzyme [Saccharothrix texasensis]